MKPNRHPLRYTVQVQSASSYCSWNVNVNSTSSYWSTGLPWLAVDDISNCLIWETCCFYLVTSLDGLAKPTSETDPSRICLPRGPADFCTSNCVGKTRYLIRDGSVSDPRRVHSDSAITPIMGSTPSSICQLSIERSMAQSGTCSTSSAGTSVEERSRESMSTTMLRALPRLVEPRLVDLPRHLTNSW